jgi:hypothetical protein
MSRSPQWVTSASLAAAVGVGIAGCGGTAHLRLASNKSPEATKLTCADSIYTATIRRGGKPKAFNAIVIGQAIFNDLRGAQHRSELQRTGAMLTYKSPLTMDATGAATISVAKVHGGRIVIIYGRNAQDQMATGRPQFSEFPAEARFALCGYKRGALRVPQFAGGFGVSRPGCYEIKVAIGSRTTSRIVSFGEGSRCPSGK